MRIAVLGAGNMGCALSVMFSQSNEVALYSHSNRKKLIKNDMKLYTDNEQEYISGKIELITDSLDESIQDADYIFITFPSFMFPDFANELVPLLKDNQHLFFIPGSGGAELFFYQALKKNCTITGLQRTHAVARIIDYGKSVSQNGIRNTLKAASIPRSFNQEACGLLFDLFHIPVLALENYLNITLVNSNPILHTSRLFSIYKEFPKVQEYNRIPLFYEEWDNESSEILVSMDQELFEIIRKLNLSGMNINHITSILDHYESSNIQQLTAKIRSIDSLKGLTTPSINRNQKLAPDFSSRYFTADFPFGLDIILSFSEILNTENESLSTVSNWFHAATQTKRSFSLRHFDLDSTEKIMKYYLL